MVTHQYIWVPTHALADKITTTTTAGFLLSQGVRLAEIRVKFIEVLNDQINSKE